MHAMATSPASLSIPTSPTNSGRSIPGDRGDRERGAARPRSASLHDTGLAIEEHYTNTGGVTDHVFGLCHLFGFRFAPRIRDIKERKLYLLPNQKAPASLEPIVGGVIDTEHITAHWDQLLRLATSIRT